MKKIAYKSHFSFRKLPQNHNDFDINFFLHEVKKYIPESYILSLKNVNVVNQNLYSLSNFNFFPKYTHYPNNNVLDVFKLFIKNFINSKRSKFVIDKGVWILDDKCNIYYHWLLDSLQRYMLLDESSKNYPVLIPKNYENKFIIEHLDYLKINYEILDEDKVFKVKNCIIPSYSAPSGNFNENILRSLQDLFLSQKQNKDSNDSNKRIWIDRVNTRREIVNKNDIEPILKKYNFQIIQTENLTIEETINIVNESDIIAGPHGSGLANILFANKYSTLIDIREDDDNYRNALFSMASALDVKYYCFAKAILDKKTEKIYLDPILFDNFLEEILQK